MKYVIAVIAAFVVPYLAFAFAANEIDPMEWQSEGRFWLVVSWCMVVPFVSVVAEDNS